MKKVIHLTGKANQVFKYAELLTIHKGSMTLKQLDKDGKTLRLDLRK
ncbi:MAG: hypothetical protein V1767_02185 [Chloroflexota bacterium]